MQTDTGRNRFFILVGFGSALLQIIYLIYKALFFEPFSLFNDFNYYSKMSVVGLVVLAAYVLVFVSKKVFKLIGIGAILALSTTLGHASAFLSVFLVTTVYLILRVPRRVKVIGGVITLIIIIGFILFLPQFSDNNAEWRLIFWKYSLQDIIQNYYGILGHGFGVPYTNQNVLDGLRDGANSPWFDVRPEETYLSPMHNSFITLAFHVGLLPSILIMVPLIKPFKCVVLDDSTPRDKTGDFFVLSVIGLFVWTSFNVVFELPHTTAFIWLVYFSTIYHFQNNQKNAQQISPS